MTIRSAIRHAFGAAALAATVAATAAGCGDNRASGATPGPPRLGSDHADQVAAVTTVLMGPEVIGAPLAPDAPAADILAAVEDAHGPTADASAEMNRFAPFPTIATPPGADVVELRADARDSADGRSIIVTSDIVVRVPDSVRSLSQFYQSQLTALGWTQTQSPSPDDPAGPYRMAFQIPGSPYPLDDFTVTVLDDHSIGALARLHYVEQERSSDATVRQRFEGWTTGLPLPAGGQVTGAGIQSSLEGRPSLWYSLELAYPGAKPPDVAAGLRASLPTTTFAVDPKPPTGDALDDWVYLTSPFFADARVSPHLSASGETTVNVDARVAFTLR